MISAAIIPARNEAQRIGMVVQRTMPFVDFVIVVDDGSTDDTTAVLQALAQPKVVVIRHQVNLGKGAALTTGCEAAMRLKVDAVVCLDADGQHNPESIPLFLSALEERQLDIVFGMRTFNSKMPIMMYLGNHFLSACINRLFRVMIHDTQSGFRAFTILAYPQLRWESSGYQAETEMIVRAGEHKLKYAEIDIDTIYLDNYKGTTVLDGIKIFLNILRWKFI